MRTAIAFVLVILFGAAFSFTACKSSGPATFCDTTCNNDTLRFSVDHPDHPFISIGMKNCLPDTITWSHDKLPAKRKLIFTDLTAKEVRINKNFLRYYIKDTSYVWLTFNDCISGQGFMVKIPFSKSGNILRKNSALNGMDPKFFVSENLAAYTDKGNIFVEDMATGKKGMMTFGKKLEEMDYTNIHETLDSVNITADRVWVKYKFENEWQTMEKKITLE
ncbi:MAG: hypothetical protein JNN00_10050 [Chitinophagaceae bacterium]|nr:hypothetical protein [Chitinophagaceae bacterium]